MVFGSNLTSFGNATCKIMRSQTGHQVCGSEDTPPSPSVSSMNGDAIITELPNGLQMCSPITTAKQFVQPLIYLVKKNGKYQTISRHPGTHSISRPWSKHPHHPPLLFAFSYT